MTNSDTDDRPYRPCVGIMVLNAHGAVFVGSRVDVPGDHWQMPQGGIDKGEGPVDAAYREVYEEIGVPKDKLELLRESSQWFHYDLPFPLSQRVWKGRYRGQKQRWFAMRFLGTDADVDLTLHKPEFDQWRWVALSDLTDLIVPFKRDIYEQVISEFSDLV